MGSSASRDVTSPSLGGHRRRCARRLVVEGVGVLPQRGGGPGQRLGHPAAEHLLHERQHLGAQPRAGEPWVGVVRVLPRRQAELGAGGVGECPPNVPAGADTTADPTPACPRSTWLRSRGRVRATPSRPGRRACARAAPARRRAPRPTPRSAPRGRRPRGRPPNRPRRKAPGRQRIPGSMPVPAQRRPRVPDSACSPWSTIKAVVGRNPAATAVSARESAPPDNATHHRPSSGRWTRATSATALRSVARGPGRSIVVVRRLPLAAAGFRGSTTRC